MWSAYLLSQHTTATILAHVGLLMCSSVPRVTSHLIWPDQCLFKAVTISFFGGVPPEVDYDSDLLVRSRHRRSTHPPYYQYFLQLVNHHHSLSAPTRNRFQKGLGLNVACIVTARPLSRVIIFWHADYDSAARTTLIYRSFFYIREQCKSLSESSCHHPAVQPVSSLY